MTPAPASARPCRCSSSGSWRWPRSASVGIIGPELAALLDQAARVCILVALAAVGLSVRIGELRSIGPKALAVGFGAAVIIGVGTLVAIVGLGLANGLSV